MGLRTRALAQGIKAATFDAALSRVTYDPDIIRRDRNQAEFTKTIWDYLDTAVSDLRIENGRQALRKWDDTLNRIEAQYGVEKEVIVAIWGLESAFGTFRGKAPVINGLATLAYDARRAAFFEAELIHALQILQDGDTTLAQLRGSWAGAMGHTQFMPSSFAAHAVDFDGDGRRNIWGDDPRDALASTGAYLRHFGWTKGQPWGIEVRLPEGFDYTIADRDINKLPSEWALMGIGPVTGAADDTHGPASILLPGGAEGAAIMIFSNFAVLEKYNTADAYVVGVGHLSDRIQGGKAIEHGWPRHLRALTKPERIELQKRLTAAGFDTVKIDAKMGPLTINAVRGFQKAKGLVPDGFPSLSLLDRLRAL
ncbi:MAG: lytic murein transglycosylase [Sulfitobacter sp.]